MKRTLRTLRLTYPRHDMEAAAAGLVAPARVSTLGESGLAEPSYVCPNWVALEPQSSHQPEQRMLFP